MSAAIESFRLAPSEICHVIDGERIMTTDTERVVEPHDHQSVIGTMATAGPDLDEASDRGLARGTARVVPHALVGARGDHAPRRRPGAGKYRDELVAATMVGQSKTFHQAEIDAACEFADFMRFNVHLAQQIYGDQPTSLPGDINILDQRPLEGSSSPSPRSTSPRSASTCPRRPP